MPDREFNLLCEPWIRVLTRDYQAQEVSLTALFSRAHELRGLDGELPTQDIALLRLALAVLHAVFARVDERGQSAPLTSADDAVDRWRALWERGQFPADVIEAYLARYADRFWLFDPQRPFYQVPEAGAGTPYGAAKLNGALSESGNKLRLFPVRTGEAKAAVSYAEAARWLLYVNGYDDTSAKPKQKGLPSPGAGWLGRLGIITAVGDTLFETLLLNLALLKNGGDMWGQECPLWELPSVPAGERTFIICPDNPSELLTLQSRRLLLKRQGGQVIGFSLLGGDFFDKTLSDSEQMTVWMLASKKDAVPRVIQPRRHDASRLMWRDFSVMFGTKDVERRPGVVSWLALLCRARLLSKKQLRFQIASVQYGDKDFFVTDVFSDALSLQSELLSALGDYWVERIEGEVALCDQIAATVSRLARDIAKASGDSEGSAAARAAREQMYYRLDLPFRRWLSGIAPSEDGLDMDDICLAWRDIAFRLAWELGRELVEQAGTAAFVGRRVREDAGGKGDGAGRLYTAPQAYNRFLYSLSKLT